MQSACVGVARSHPGQRARAGLLSSFWLFLTIVSSTLFDSCLYVLNSTSEIWKQLATPHASTLSFPHARVGPLQGYMNGKKKEAQRLDERKHTKPDTPG